MKIAGLVIDAWKLPIFERHLRAANYAYTNVGKIINDETLLLKVETDRMPALAQVVLAANQEAARTNKDSPV